MSLTSSFGLDPEIEAQLRAIGPVFRPETVEFSRNLFAGRADPSLPEGGSRVDDVAYGDDARHKLDIVSPAGGPAPVVLFIPGGGMTGGDKAFYAHIPASFARRGFVGVAMNYRLAPQHLFPAGAEDVALAIDWLHRNIEGFGGDREAIFVLGQSAGAIHAASALFDQRFQPKAVSSIQAAMLMSGVYKITPDHDEPKMNLYFGNDARALVDRSPCNHVDESTVPVMLSVAELEPGLFGVSAAALMEALSRRDRCAPQITWLRGHNHLSPVLNMGGPGDTLGAVIAEAFRARLR